MDPVRPEPTSGIAGAEVLPSPQLERVGSEVDSGMELPSTQSLRNPHAMSQSLIKYLTIKERHEMFSIGILSPKNHQVQLSRHLNTIRGQLGEPTEAQRLAGEAALERLDPTLHAQSQEAVNAKSLPLVMSWHHPIEGPVLNHPSTAHPSTITSLRETVSTSVTAPTSLGMETFAVAGPEIISSELTPDMTVELSKLMRLWPCDAGCQAVFRREGDLNHHKEVMHPSKSWACEFCQQEFTELPPFLEHVRKRHRAEAESSERSDATLNRKKQCAYCELESAQCQHSAGCLDGDLAEAMPVGAWDMSILDQELSHLDLQVRTQTTPSPSSRTTAPSQVQRVEKKSSRYSEQSQRTSPVEHSAKFTCPTNASDVSSESCLSYEVEFDAWAQDIVASLLDEVYKQLARDAHYVVRTHAGQQEQQAGVSGSRSLQAPLDNAPHRENNLRKRRRALSSVSSRESGGDQQKRPIPRNTPLDGNEEGPGYACPYFQIKPQLMHYKSCTNGNKGWEDIKTLRHNHILRHHYARKSSKLISDKALRERGPEKWKSMEGRWELLFDVIFPNYGKRPSAYHDPNKLKQWESKLRKELGHRDISVQKAIIARAMMPQAMQGVGDILREEKVPDEITPRIQWRIELLIKEYFTRHSENPEMVTRTAIQHDSRSSLSDISKTVMTRDDAFGGEGYGSGFENMMFQESFEIFNTAQASDYPTQQSGTQNTSAPDFNQPNTILDIENPTYPLDSDILPQGTFSHDSASPAPRSNDLLLGLDALGNNQAPVQNGSEFIDSGYASYQHLSELCAPRSHCRCPPGKGLTFVDCEDECVFCGP